MPAANAAVAPAPVRELVITRVFDAPRALVWKMWTDPRHAMQWWGPRGYPATDMTLDVRPGGRWRHCLTARENGAELWQHGVFREVVAPERLVFTFQWEMEGERGLETMVTVRFTDLGGKTRMDFRQAPFQSDYECDGHRDGWNSTFDRLVDHLTDGKEGE